MFVIGNKYTRREIADELGGSAIDFLPMVDGKVVCACLREDLNPNAPKIVLVGFGPQRELSAAAICEQGGDVPVFIRRDVNAWEYRGQFAVVKSSTDPKEIKERDNRADTTEGISRVIYLKEVSKGNSLRLSASAVKR